MLGKLFSSDATTPRASQQQQQNPFDLIHSSLSASRKSSVSSFATNQTTAGNTRTARGSLSSTPTGAGLGALNSPSFFIQGHSRTAAAGGGGEITPGAVPSKIATTGKNLFTLLTLLDDPLNVITLSHIRRRT